MKRNPSAFVLESVRGQVRLAERATKIVAIELSAPFWLRLGSVFNISVVLFGLYLFGLYVRARRYQDEKLGATVVIHILNTRFALRLSTHSSFTARKGRWRPNAICCLNLQAADWTLFEIGCGLGSLDLTVLGFTTYTYLPALWRGIVQWFKNQQH